MGTEKNKPPFHPDDKSHKGRAIVTYGRSLMSVVIGRSLAKRGIDVISCDSLGMTAASFSKATSDSFIHADQEKDPNLYLQDMKANILKFKPDDDRPYILIPGFRDAKFLSKHADFFDGLITLAAPQFDAIDQVDPKDHLARTLETLMSEGRNVPAPKTIMTENIASLSKAVSHLSMPALIKAVDEVGGRGIDFFDDREALLACAQDRVKRESPPPLLQEAADGEDYCLAVICKDGEILAHMAYHNIQTLPREGGAGAIRETIDDTPFLHSAQTLLRETGWTGIAEIDFMWTGQKNDTPLLIEVNPRFWAGLFQSVESGVDFPWLLYCLFAYGTLPEAEAAELGTKTKIPAVWTAGALADALSEGTDLEAVKAAWAEMVEDTKAGNWGDIGQSVKDIFLNITDFEEASAVLRRQRSHAQSAKSELMLGEDPMSSLGVFFILSSLLRHGELPPEVKN